MSWLSNPSTIGNVGSNFWTSGGGGGGSSPDSVGGLSPEDRAFIDSIYSDYQGLPDAYEKYTGKRFADISPEEQELLNKLKTGGGYKALYDKAQGTYDEQGNLTGGLGLAGDVYKGDMQRTDQDILDQAEALRNPFLSGQEEQIQRFLSKGLADANIQNNYLGSTLGADRSSRTGVAMQPAQEALFQSAGDAYSNLQYKSFQDSINRARQLNQDRTRGADAYGNYVMQDLGLGTGGLDKDYGTRMNAFMQDRANTQRGLDFDFQEYQLEKMFPFTKLGFGANLVGSMPLEQKTAVQQPASGGK